MVNLVDADTAKSFLLIWDEPTRQWAADRLGMTFVGLGLESHPAILRKQIVARLLGLLP
jgi:hypothetical protein